MRSRRLAPLAAAVLAAGLGLPACERDGGGDTDGPRRERTGATTTDADVAIDPRLAYLLAGCARAGEPYDVQTAEITAILVETLVSGQRDALKRAKMELGAGGDEALRGVRRLAESYWSQQHGVHYVTNALDAARLSDSPLARELFLRGLEHTSSSIRTQSAEALARHGLPEDFDAVVRALEIAPPEMRRRYPGTLLALDRLRAEVVFATWLEEEAWEPLREQIAPMLAATQQPGLVAIFERSMDAFGPNVQVFLVAPLARAGDADALARLRGWIRGQDPLMRHLGLRAAVEAGLVPELVWTLSSDPIASQRQSAARGLAALEDPTPYLAYLREGLSDPDEGVREACLSALLDRGDAEARDRALALLSSERADEAQLGLRVLAGRWAADPEITREALERLSARYEAVRDRPLSEQQSVVLLQAIGQVPLPEAARLLMRLARERPLETVQHVRAFRWLALQAGNGGPTAQAYLADELRAEPDPLRRLDLLDALSAGGGAAARELLLELLAEEELRPYERLFAARRLVQVGPAWRVLPVLKRECLRTVQPDVRVGLRCLLWAWYPKPR